MRDQSLWEHTLREAFRRPILYDAQTTAFGISRRLMSLLVMQHRREFLWPPDTLWVPHGTLLQGPEGPVLAQEVEQFCGLAIAPLPEWCHTAIEVAVEAQHTLWLGELPEGHGNELPFRWGWGYGVATERRNAMQCSLLTFRLR